MEQEVNVQAHNLQWMSLASEFIITNRWSHAGAIRERRIGIYCSDAPSVNRKDYFFEFST